MARYACAVDSSVRQHGPVAQLVSAPPCHGGGRGFESRQGRRSGVRFGAIVRRRGGIERVRPGSSVGMSIRLKSEGSPVRSRPWPPSVQFREQIAVTTFFVLVATQRLSNVLV